MQMKAGMQAATSGHIAEAIALGTKVYEQARNMCKCKSGVVQMPTIAKPTQADAVKDAEAARATANAAVEEVKAEAAALENTKTAVGDMPPGPEKTAAEQQIATEEQTVANATAVAAMNAATANETAKAAAEIPIAPTPCPNASAPATAESETPAPGTPAAMQTLEKEGVVNASAVNGLPPAEAAKLAEKVQEKEDDSEDEAVVKQEEVMSEKEQDAELVKERINFEKSMTQYKMVIAANRAAARGQDVQKVIKEVRQKGLEAEAADQAKESAKPDTSERGMKLGLAAANKEAAEEEQRHVGKMMEDLPAGMGLRGAFTRIEESKVSEDETLFGGILKGAEGDVGKDKGESIKGLSKEAQAVAQEMQNAETKNAQKPKEEPIDLVKEEKKIEKSKLPGKSGSDKVMFGKSSNSMANDLATPVEELVE